MLILADAGGSNSYRSRNWKRQVQEQLADGLGLSVTVCHYPTGASKEMASLALEQHATCPCWNYTIRARISGSDF